MTLSGRHILLLSPQAWGVSRISKHHYALEMARRGARVTFVSPPDTSGSLPLGGFALSRVESGVDVLTYRAPFPLRLKFYAPTSFARLMAWQARRIVRALHVSGVDLVWDFVNGTLFSDLRAFPAHGYVYHPVDMVSSSATKGADVIFSLADNILERFAESHVPRHFVNHGLGQAFAAQANASREQLAHSHAELRGPLRIGYAGNLHLPCIDHANVRGIVDAHPQVEFHFWGPHSTRDNTLGGGGDASLRFVRHLEGRSNVRLHGPVAPEQLARELARMNALFLCYDAKADPNAASNSHKILEYLSTGRPVIASHITSYARFPGVLEMLPAPDNTPFAAHFAAALTRLPELLAPDAQRARIDFALAQTYAKQLDRIESVLVSQGLLGAN